MNKEKVYISYSDYESLNSGINPTAKWQVIEDIKIGKEYIVERAGSEFRAKVDEAENLILEHLKDKSVGWITDKTPSETGAYLVSVLRKRGLGKLAFRYIAYYDRDQNKWFKYDPFDDGYEPKEDITYEVTAWSKDDFGVMLK